MQRKGFFLVVFVAVSMMGIVPLAALTSLPTVSESEAVSNDVQSAQNLQVYDLLLVTPAQFSDKLQPLVSHKNALEIKTVMVTLMDIYEGTYFPTEGRDDAEKVKYFIKNAYDEWDISYVLLVGGRNGGLFKEKWLCPVRYSYCGVSSGWETNFLSDLYFADLYDSEGQFSSWDSNDNGVFGEWTAAGALDSPIDLYPDVAVGRWACRATFEVDIMVEKTIIYENHTYGQDWFNTMLCIAGDTYPADLNPEWEGLEGEEGTQKAMDWMPGFDYVTLWTSDGTLSGPDDVIDAVSNGCGFLFFDGHGSPMSWATHPPEDHNTWIDGLNIWQMRLLENGDALPICVVGGCHNSQFNISVLNALKIWEGYDHWYEYLYKGETGPECWSWWLTRKIGGGSIATLGYSALGYTKEDKNFTGEASEWLDTYFFWEYGMQGTEMLGDIWTNVISAYLDEYPIDWNADVESPTAIDAKTAQEWILLGDPSLKIGGYP